MGELPAFPVVSETVRECIEDYLDLAGLRLLLDEIASGRTRLVRADVETPSPFGHGLLLAGQYGSVIEADRRERCATGNSATASASRSR